jgi:hypothetical protein
VGKVETIDKDWVEICRRIGIDPVPELPHTNTTTRTHYRDYYTPQTRKLVQERFKKTIELFGYTY